jgi:hypothetical protein
MAEQDASMKSLLTAKDLAEMGEEDVIPGFACAVAELFA